MSSAPRPSVVLITPALAAANNGNWQTAHRWAGMLAADYAVRVMQHWDGSPAAAMIALHARRSAADVAAWHARHPGRPLLLALTGTDLYRDIHGDEAARHSLALADRLIVLQDLAPLDVPAEHRTKCVVCFQSCASRRTLPKTTQRLRALMVGHLRDEKLPQTYFAAAERLAGRDDILLDHVGAALDPALGEAAQALMRRCPHYRWLGPLPHGAVRQRIQRAHVLVHASRMEGGAHVVMEAITSGTPVLASRIPGNLGLLGAGYEAVFEVGDDAALAGLLQRARDDAAMLPRWLVQCRERAPLFEPERERATLRRTLSELLETSR